MRRVDRSVRLVGPRHDLPASRNVHVAEHATEHGERGERLVEGDFVARLVDPHEAEVAVLPHLAVFGPVDDEGGVACGAELGRVGVIDLERDGLATKPVADVVCVAMIQSYSDGIVEDRFKICEKVWVNEVASFLKCIVNVIVGFCVIKIDSQGVLGRRQIEIVGKVSWRRGIFIGVADTKP